MISKSVSSLILITSINKIFEIQFRNWFHIEPPKDYSQGERFASLEEARNTRKVSGDLVVHSDTKKIVTDLEWLWDFEKQDPNSYAQEAIAWQKCQKESK